MEQLKFLADAGIHIHTQIVLCRGINDEDYLQRSISNLGALYPNVQSIAIVPVGLSAHRKNKTPILPIDAEYSISIIEIINDYQRLFQGDYGSRIVWAADEFYLSAGVKIPGAAAYEGYPQIENGIGLVRQFLDSASRNVIKEPIQSVPEKPIKVTIITGKLAEPIIRDWAVKVSDVSIDFQVIGIENSLFGKSVTVAGLISGNDVINQLNGLELGELLAVSEVCLRDGAFLDDVSLNDLESKLNVKVIEVPILPSVAIKKTRQIVKEWF
jgi:putative radical SAM enzyme (TIGR03279 family)